MQITAPLRRLALVAGGVIAQVLFASAAHAAAPAIAEYEWSSSGQEFCVGFTEAVLEYDLYDILDDLRVVGEADPRHIGVPLLSDDGFCVDFDGPPLGTGDSISFDMHGLYDVATETLMTPVDDYVLVDVAYPVLIAAHMTGGNEVTLLYSEPVNLVNMSELQVVDGPSGEDEHDVTSVSGGGTDTLVLTFDGAAEPSDGENTLFFDWFENDVAGYVEDLAGNINDAGSYSLNSGDGPEIIYVDDDYTEEGDNDGHTWGVDAFASILDAESEAVARIDQTFMVAAGDYDVGTSGVQLDLDRPGVSIIGPGAGSDVPVEDRARLYNTNCSSVLYVDAPGGARVEGLHIEVLNEEQEPCHTGGGEYESSSAVYLSPGKSDLPNTGLVVSGNYITGAYYGVFFDLQVVRAEISDNEFVDNRYGVFVSNAAVYNDISNNHFSNHRYGVALSAGDGSTGGNVVRDNVFTANPDDEFTNEVGVLVEYSFQPNDPVIIQSNTFESLGCQGVYINWSSGVSVVGNDILNNGGDCEDTGMDVVIPAWHADTIVIRHNRFIGNVGYRSDLEAMGPFGLYVFRASGEDYPTIDARYNYWGDAAGPFHATENPESAGDAVSNVGDTCVGCNGDVDYLPYYTDETLEHLSDGSFGAPVDLGVPVIFNVPDDAVDPELDVSELLDEDLSGELPEITINADTEAGQVIVEIPEGTTVSGGEGWDGTIHAPTVQDTDSVNLPDGDAQAVIEIGFGSIPIYFDRGVRILMAGHGGELVGYSYGPDDFTEITDVCADDTQATGDALPAAGDCKIDVGIDDVDLVVWTKHFSSFIPFTPPPPTPPTPARSGGGGSRPQVFVTLLSPNGGETLAAGSAIEATWSVTGEVYEVFRVLLSTDGGSTFNQVVATAGNAERSASWVVPATATADARLRLEIILPNGYVIAFDNSDAAFSITGSTTTPVVRPGMKGDPDFDLLFVRPPGLETLPCEVGARVKATGAAVYYCGSDGMRHAFPNEQVYYSWFNDFMGIQTISDSALAAIPLGRNMTYRTGSRLVKIQTVPTVYVIERGATIRAIPDEETAALFYGPDWSKYVDDVSDAFFANYKEGKSKDKKEYVGHVTLLK